MFVSVDASFSRTILRLRPLIPPLPLPFTFTTDFSFLLLSVLWFRPLIWKIFLPKCILMNFRNFNRSSFENIFKKDLSPLRYIRMYLCNGLVFDVDSCIYLLVSGSRITSLPDMSRVL